MAAASTTPPASGSDARHTASPRRPLLVAAGLTAATVATTIDPVRRWLVPPCPFRAVTGIDCPLCGGTRAIDALARLDIAGAANQHLLVTVLAPLAALGVLAWLGWSFAADRRDTALDRAPRVERLVPWVTAAFLAFAVLRALPIDQLGWLRSG